MKYDHNMSILMHVFIFQNDKPHAIIDVMCSGMGVVDLDIWGNGKWNNSLKLFSG